MKLVKRKANLIIAVICAINVPVCAFVAFKQNEARFAVTAAASVLLAFSNLYYALAPRTSENREDERDIFIARKSGSDAFKLSCWLVNAAALIFAIVYAVSREPVCLTVSLTLIAASAALCIIYVVVSCYYYKHN